MSRMAKPKVGIVLVNYNFGQHILDCLTSIDKVKDEAEIEVWVVDNYSKDNSVAEIKKQFKWVKLIENQENLGFGKACNQALRQIKDGYSLLLNPDTILGPGVLKYMLNFMDQNPRVGASSCKVVLDNGQIDLTAHRGFPTPWASLLYLLGNDSLYHLSNSDMTKPHEVDVLAGAFMLIRSEILREVDYFDEDYFLYGEDIDLCYKIKHAGYKIMYVPEVEVLHIKGVASGLKKHSQQKTTADIETKKRSLQYFHSTMKIFYDKHYKSQYPFWVTGLVYWGINLKWWLAKRKLTV